MALALGLDPDDVLDLAATMNPCAPDPSPTIARHADAARHYPEPAAAHAALAAAMGVDPARLVLTNGGAEAIALVASHLERGHVEPPEFALYEQHLELDPTAGRWRSNPHSPTGRLAHPDERAAVWDEAFYPLTTGRWTRGDAGCWVVGSLTKLLGCPGLRAGYALAPSADDATAIRRRQPRWSVNALACAALPEMLAAVDLAGWSAEIARLRGALVDGLQHAGFTAEAGEAPWVLIAGSAGLRDRLAHHGVIVRDCASFGLPSHTRIAVPDRRGLDRLLGALERMNLPGTGWPFA